MAVDYDRLERTMRVLGYAPRLALLSLLRNPHTADEIHLAPGRDRSGDRPTRPISRQAVQGHLEQLVAEGFVRVKRSERPEKRGLNEYVVDEAHVFAAVEELRKVSAMAGSGRFEPFETMVMGGMEDRAWEAGPKLVVVHGIKEGKSFPLSATNVKPGRGWVIGRRPGTDVCLGYDPFVSQENAEVIKRGKDFVLLDLRSARNGTSLNWVRLPPGAESPLLEGDVIGVGRSLLLFRTR